LERDGAVVQIRILDLQLQLYFNSRQEKFFNISHPPQRRTGGHHPIP